MSDNEQPKPDQNLRAKDHAERRLWDAVSQGSGGQPSRDLHVEANMDLEADPRLAENVRIVDRALRSMEQVEEPRSMQSNIEARIAESARQARILRPQWRVFGLSSSQLALAAAVLVTIGLGASVAIQQGSAVDPAIAVGSMGSGSGTASTTEVLLSTGGVRISALSVESASAPGSGREIAFAVEDLSSAETLRVFAGGELVATLQGTLGPSAANSEQSFTIPLETAQGGLRFEIGDEVATGRIIVDASGGGTRWVTQ